MRVSVETMSGLERRVTVGVPADRVDSAVLKRLKEAASNVRLPGFRPGKVPMRVMQQRFGPGVRQEVLGEVISQSFQEAVMSENLRPAGQPSIEARKMGRGREPTPEEQLYGTSVIKYVNEIETNKKPPVDVQEIWKQTQSEIQEGIASELRTREEMDEIFGPGNWRPFWQAGKWRLIDDGKRSRTMCWRYAVRVQEVQIIYIVCPVHDVLLLLP